MSDSAVQSHTHLFLVDLDGVIYSISYCSVFLLRLISMVVYHAVFYVYKKVVSHMLRLLFPKRFYSTQRMSIFSQCLNPLTGLATWEEKEENYDYHQEVARSAFADMLHDHERNEKYYIALKAAIDKKHAAGEEANVLDIGTGTGLLSMMAAKCGADTITACEAFTPMAQCAVRIIEENGFEDKIKLIHKRSTKMTVGTNGDMPKRANILVTEVFDTELIGEGALSTFKHAHEILLERNSIVVPSSGTVWVQVIESSMINSWNRINPVKNGEKYLVDTPLAVKTCSGAAAVHDMQLTQIPLNAFKPLIEPQPIFRFDWSGKEPLIYDEKKCLNVIPICSGTAHAIFMWWDLNMDTENQVLLSCAPAWVHPDKKQLEDKGLSYSEITDAIPWRDHWMQAVYYFPMETPLSKDTEVSLIGYHDEYSLWFQLISERIKEVPDCERPICSCGVHVGYSRTRMGQLNDTPRNEKYIKALEKKITSDTIGLCLSDGCLLSLAALNLGAKQMFVLETNTLSKRTMEMFAKANGLLDRLHIVESIDDLPKDNEINLIFGEPFFITSIIPWDNLRFWYLVSRYSSDIDRMPIRATIKGVVVEFKDLHKIRAPLGICEGFDLSIFDKLVQSSSDKCDSSVEAQPLWEYPGRALSEAFVIKEIDLTQNIKELKTFKISDTVPILRSGSCNGVALWVDWHLDQELTVSSGPMTEITAGERISWDPFTRQGVHLFKVITDVTPANMLSWTFRFAPEHGNIETEFTILPKT